MPRKKPPLGLPGRNGAFEVGERVVDNPFASLPDPQRDRDTKPEPKTQRVPVNTRETPIEHMLVRGVIDRDQKAAADWFRKRFELSRFSIGSTWSVSTKGKAEGTTILPTHVLEALEDLYEARLELGGENFELLEDVCDVGRSLTEVANHWFPNKPNEKQIWFVGETVRKSLKRLGLFLQGKSKKSRPANKPEFFRGFAGLTSNQADWTVLTEIDQKRSSRRAKKI